MRIRRVQIWAVVSALLLTSISPMSLAQPVNWNEVLSDPVPTATRRPTATPQPLSQHRKRSDDSPATASAEAAARKPLTSAHGETPASAKPRPVQRKAALRSPSGRMREPNAPRRPEALEREFPWCDDADV